MAKTSRSIFDAATVDDENNEGGIANFDQEDLNIPLADDSTDEDEDDEDDEPEQRPQPKRSKSKVEEPEEEEDEEEEEETEDEDDSEEDEDEPEVSVYEATALELIDNGVLIPTEDKNYEDSPLGLSELVEDTVEARIKARIPQEYQSILDAIEAGIPAEQWAVNQRQVPFEDADLEDEDTQKYLITENLKSQGLDAEKIAKKIARYEKEGSLEEEAEEAQALLIKKEASRKKEYDEQLATTLKKKKEDDAAIVATIKNEIDSTKEIAGFYVNKQEQKQLFDYVNKPVNPKGQTQYEIDRNDPKKLVKLAYLAMKGVDSKKLTKVVESKAARKLRDSLDESGNDRATSGKGRAPKERVQNSSMRGRQIWDAPRDVDDNDPY